MTTVTLYTVHAQQVELADGFTASRQPGGAGPAHCLGNGDVLLGMRQMPLNAVWRRADGSYIVLAPELREVLDGPIIEAERLRYSELLTELNSAPLWLRLWRALRPG